MRYAQIEKELLAIVFSFEKFHYFTYGQEVVVQTDHKPLIAIFKKDLNKISARLQRMLLKLLKYKIKLTYLPGREMYISDTLSRAYINENTPDDPEMQYTIHSLVDHIPMSDQKKITFTTETSKDKILSKVKTYLETGWPSKNLNSELRYYYNLRNQLYLSQGILLIDKKVVVPESLKQEMLKLIHEGHFGVSKCKARARHCLIWQKMNDDIEKYVKNCEMCQRHQKSNQKEPIINHNRPNRPWQYVFSDIFEYNKQNYVILVDTYSNWIEATLIKHKNVNEVKSICQNVFTRFGFPEILYADNNPYNSSEMKEFANKFNFKLEFSSPYHHKSNGPAEKAVSIVKNILKKTKDPNNLNLYIMQYNNSPLATGISPAQLLLNRTLKTKFPAHANHFMTKVIDAKLISEKFEVNQQKRNRDYDKNAKTLTKLYIGQNVLIQNSSIWEKGKVIGIYIMIGHILLEM